MPFVIGTLINFRTSYFTEKRLHIGRLVKGIFCTYPWYYWSLNKTKGSRKKFDTDNVDARKVAFDIRKNVCNVFEDFFSLCQKVFKVPLEIQYCCRSTSFLNFFFLFFFSACRCHLRDSSFVARFCQFPINFNLLDTS